MDWLRWLRSAPPTVSTLDSPEPPATEGSAPGVAALLEDVSEDRSHSVLDLGPAAESSLRLYSRFARHIRFADLPAAGAPEPWAEVIGSLPPQPEHPYDLLFGWDILDRLDEQHRPLLVERLAELSAPRARLHLLVESSSGDTTRPLRFALVDVDRMRYEPAGPEKPAHAPLLPAQVERLLKPFKVVRAYTLKFGLREYVAVLDRNGASPRELRL